MLNLTMGIETAIRSLRSHSYALNTVNHNVANMNNPDYSRQLANITAAAPYSITGQAGQIGTGSDVSRIERIRDIYLDRQIRTEWMNFGRAELLDRTYQNLKAFFPEVDGVTTAGLGSQIDEFFTAWDDVSAQAKLAALGSANDLNGARNKVYQLADGISRLLNTKSSDLTNMQIDLNADLKRAVAAVNVELREIYQLNKDIKFISGQGQQPNDLLDKRDASLARLAELINFEVGNRSDGTIVVHLSGRPLVNGADGYNTMMTMTSATINTATLPVSFSVKDSKLEDVGISSTGGSSPFKVDKSVFTGGKIAGILESRDTVVHNYKSMLDSIANTLMTVVNSIYKASQTGGNTDNKAFFTGTLASDIAVNKSITSGNDISYTMYQDGDIAEMLGALKNKLVSTRVVSEPLTLTSNSLLSAVPLAPGTNGEIIINNIHIAVNDTMTLKDLINAINTHSNLFSAVYNDISKEFFMVANEPLLIQEVGLGGQFLRNMKLIQEQISTSTVVYKGSMTNQNVSLTGTWRAQNNIFDFEASKTGKVIINMENNRYEINWLDTNSILGTTWAIFALDGNSATPPGISMYNYFPDEKFHFGTRVGNGGVANAISPFIMTDEKGNLTETMKIVGNMRFNEYYKSLIGDLEGDINSSENMVTSYATALDQLSALQESITHVDDKEELARAKNYQRAYDASVKLMSVIDEMLNMLINRTATQSSSLD